MLETLDTHADALLVDDFPISFAMMLHVIFTTRAWGVC